MSKKRSLPLSKVYALLEPGPVVMVSTARKDKPNIMCMSWHMMMEFEPPLVGCLISNRNYTFEILRASKECVLNIPTKELATQMVGCGNTSGRKVDKFKKFGLTPVSGSVVHAPMIGECYANLECKVVSTKMVEKYNMFVLEVVKAWIDPSVKNPATIHHREFGKFFFAGPARKLPSKMR